MGFVCVCVWHGRWRRERQTDNEKGEVGGNKGLFKKQEFSEHILEVSVGSAFCLYISVQELQALKTRAE